MEHLPRDKWPLMLEELYRVTNIGGVCFIEVPDFKQQIKEMVLLLDQKNNEWDRHIARTGIWGKTERLGMGHCFGFDWDLLSKAIRTVGFDKVQKSTDMISNHGKDMPVILAKATKQSHNLRNLKELSFNELRELILW